MHTIMLDQPGELRLTTTDAPAPPEPGEALVRVRRVGICGTDIHAFHGRQPFFAYPRILGHELGVEVAALGAGVTHLALGDRCAVEPYLNCGTCIACRRGRTNCCVHLRVLGVHTDGGMRDLIVVPAAKLHRANELAFEQLALVETLAIGAHAVQRAQLTVGEWVLVIGAGPIGLATMQFAHLAGARVIALDMSESRLAFCQRQGTADAIVVAGDAALARIGALTGGDMPTAVFDATGSAPSMLRAFDYVAHSGRLILVGIVQNALTFDDPAFHRRELTLLATRNALAEDFTRIIAHIAAGRIDTRPWITHQAAATDLVGVFPGWLQPDAGLIKGVVAFD